MKNRVCELFQIRYPIIQAGMVWVSGWKLASAVSNCGGLGLIGAGSMKPDLLREHIQKCKLATDKPYGVNLPLLRGDIEDLIKVVIEEDVKIVFTSAGHPGKYIDRFKDRNVKVAHVVSSLKQGLKAESVGCDAIVGEGVEAGGHNGADQLSVFSLIPSLSQNVKIPIIAAGGIVNSKGILAAFALGAEGVQVGTRFAATVESSAHDNYKRKIVEAQDNSTVLILQKIGLVRAIKNNFTERIQKLESEGASVEQLREALGAKREKLGIFDGDVDEGLIEAGQGVGLINDIPAVKELFDRFISEINQETVVLNDKLKVFTND